MTTKVPLRNLRGKLWARVLRDSQIFSDPFDQERARFLLVVSLVLGAAALVPIIIRLASGSLNWHKDGSNLLVLLCMVLTNLMLWRRKLTPAGLFFVFGLSVFFLVRFANTDASGLALALAIPVVTAGLLLGSLYVIIITGALLAGVAVVSYLRYQPLAASLANPFAVTSPLLDAALIASGLVALAAFVILLTNAIFRTADAARRTARQLQAAAVVSEVAASAASSVELLNIVVERIREAFGFYHAQVFLLDQENRLARLEASTGQAGATLLARGHALPVGSQSVVGQCTASGMPVVVNETRTSAIHRPNRLLPDTRAELALPLVVGTQVIGALDVQSTEPEVFQPGDVQTLQIMAAQLASAIDKARLLDEMQARVIENQRLYEESQASLQQIEELSRRLTREGWSDYLRARRAASGLGYTLQGTAVMPDANWTATMRQAYSGESSVVVRQDRNANIAAIPLRVRGEVIGVLQIERGGERHWTDDELEMAETLVDRLSMAIENARLYEQASLAASREQVVNVISQEVQAAGSMDEVLRAALAELGAALGASRGIVQINPQPSAEAQNSTDRPVSQTKED